MSGAVCKCRRGYASRFDGKCDNCRTRREKLIVRGMRRAHAEGYAKGEAFPHLTDRGCPYGLHTGPLRDAWIMGKNEAHQAAKAP